MVKRSKLDFDDSLFKGEKKPIFERGRIDNTLAVMLVLDVALIVLLVLTTKSENWWAVFLIGLLFLTSELFALPMKLGGRLSIAMLPLVMAMMVSGPLGAAVVALFGIPVFYLERGEQGFKRIMYNTCQMFLSAGLAAWVFWHTGGGIILNAGKADLSNVLKASGGKLILPWLLATLVFFALNTLLVVPVLAGSEDRMFRLWEKRFLARLPGYLLYSGIGFLSAIVYTRIEFAGVLLIFAPLVGIRVVYTRVGTMRDVCDDTTLAVMAAVEGGKIFKEGHSVGVADMAEAIAEEMDFQEEDIHFLRQAALLHDIGKLALDESIVEKPGMLEPEEYEKLKKHPLIGGEIVSREESFALVASSVVHHHEMVDGSGYVDGLSGDSIPIGARILAVANAFDAMQRPSAFRAPLDVDNAAAEIIRGKGIQFDPEVVDAFIKVIKKRGIWTGALKGAIPAPGEIEGEGAPKAGVEQPTLEETVAQATADTGPEVALRHGATPADGIAYTKVRDEIEKDIREWKRTESGRQRRRPRGESRRTSPVRKKKDQGP